MQRRRQTRLVGLAGVGLAAAAVIANLTVSADEGWGTRALVCLPILLAGIGAIGRSRAAWRVAAAGMFGWCVLGAASVGIFYVPSLIALVVGFSLARRPARVSGT